MQVFVWLFASDSVCLCLLHEFPGVNANTFGDAESSASSKLRSAGDQSCDLSVGVSKNGAFNSEHRMVDTRQIPTLNWFQSSMRLRLT